MSALVSTIEAVDTTLYHVPVLADGPALCTEIMLAAMAAARHQSPSALGYGRGGGVRLHQGAYRMGALPGWSRLVGLKGPGGALGLAVIQSDYTALLGQASEDALFPMLDDGTQQASVVMQQIVEGFSIDGRRNLAPPGHRRHGLWYKPAGLTPDGKKRTDRAPVVRDFHAAGLPGTGLKIQGNDQVRGGNFKVLDCDEGLDWEKVSDAKVGDIGLGGNRRKAYRFSDCASLEVDKLDAWTGAGFIGEYLGEVISCRALEMIGGQHEGMVLIRGDNDKPNSGTYRIDVAITYHMVGFKVSTEFAKTRGAAYTCHLRVEHAFGVRLPAVTFGCGRLNDEGVPEHLAERPRFAIETVGDCSIDCTGTEFIAFYGDDDRPTYCAFTERPCNRPDQLVGVRYGDVNARPIGKPRAGEHLADGSRKSVRRFPMGYIFCEEGPEWTRKLTDQVDEFIVPDWSAVPCRPGWAWYVTLE